MAQIPGCDRPWSESKTFCLHWSGTRGRGMPVEMSQRMVSVELARGSGLTTKGEIGEDSSACSWRFDFWSLAIAMKSRTGGCPDSKALDSMCDSASATTLSRPLMWRILDVN